MYDFVEAVNLRLNKRHNYAFKNISSKRHAWASKLLTGFKAAFLKKSRDMFN